MTSGFKSYPDKNSVDESHSSNVNLIITGLCLISAYGLFKILHNNVGYKVGMLTHKYEHKPERKIKVVINCHQLSMMLFMMPDILTATSAAKEH